MKRAVTTTRTILVTVLISSFALLGGPQIAFSDTNHVAANAEDASGILGEKVKGAERLEGRLLAPCCWNQTLDIHGSEISLSLRREIRTRLKAGESADAIEQSLIERYGSRLRAVPDVVPVESAALVGFAGLFVAAVVLLRLLVVWRRRRTTDPLTELPAESTESPAGDTELLDKRLDEELRRLD